MLLTENHNQIENTAKDQNKNNRKKKRGSLFSKTHAPQTDRKKKKAILHKKYCSLIHQNKLYKDVHSRNNPQSTCRNKGQTQNSYCE
jgi:hypothetical protein